MLLSLRYVTARSENQELKTALIASLSCWSGSAGKPFPVSFS